MREVWQPTAVVDIKVGQEDVAHVVNGVTESGDLPDGGLTFVEDRLGGRDPGVAEAVTGRTNVAEPQPGLDEHEPVPLGFEQQTVVDGMGGRRPVVGGLDPPDGPTVEVMDQHADYPAT